MKGAAHPTRGKGFTMDNLKRLLDDFDVEIHKEGWGDRVTYSVRLWDEGECLEIETKDASLERALELALDNAAMVANYC